VSFEGVYGKSIFFKGKSRPIGEIELVANPREKHWCPNCFKKENGM